MDTKRILFVSGSIGLGHAIRDIAIATNLRSKNPAVKLFWLAAPPANAVLEEADERLLPESAMFADDSAAAEDAADNSFRLNLLKYISHALGAWKNNVNAFRQVTNRYTFDLIVADEAYEISMAIDKGIVKTDTHFIMIYDFFGNISMSWNQLRVFVTRSRHKCSIGLNRLRVIWGFNQQPIPYHR